MITSASLHLGDLGYGLALGGLALVAAIGARTGHSSHWRGLAASAAPLAAAVVLVARHRAPGLVLVAVALGCTGAIAAHPIAVRGTGLAAAVLVAIALPSSYAFGPRFAAALVVVLVGVGLEIARRPDPRTFMVLLGLTVLGVWAAVPDTESIILVAGAIAPIAATVLISPRVGTPPASWPLGAVVVAAMASGATARPDVLAGAMACWGVLAVLAVTRRPLRLRADPRVAVLLIATQLVVVVAASRWAARIALSARAWIVSAALVGATALVVGLIATGADRSGERTEP